MTTLIVGAGSDPHVDAVAALIKGKGRSVKLMDAANPAPVSLATDCGSETLCFGHDSVRSQDVTHVWWRLKPSFFADGDPNRSRERGFADREWQHLGESLETYLDRARWINPRSVDRKFRYKPTQLHYAKLHGFKVPRTLVSNDARRIVEFAKSLGGECIYKPLSWYFVPKKLLYANKVTAAQLEALESTLSISPGIFQEIVPKAYELRVTVVSERIFAIKIDSQKRLDTQLDWRRNQKDVSYEVIELGAELRSRLTKFHRQAGLVYAAYDLIVTPSEEEIFLEVNPAGQWLWLEEATGTGICAALAYELSL